MSSISAASGASRGGKPSLRIAGPPGSGMGALFGLPGGKVHPYVGISRGEGGRTGEESVLIAPNVMAVSGSLHRRLAQNQRIVLEVPSVIVSTPTRFNWTDRRPMRIAIIPLPIGVNGTTMLSCSTKPRTSPLGSTIQPPV